MRLEKRFQFRKNVSFKNRPDGCFLVSSFPLRAVRLAPSWIPYFEHLEQINDLPDPCGEEKKNPDAGRSNAKNRERCQSVSILPIPGDLKPDEAYRFLMQLVYRGFLEEKIETLSEKEILSNLTSDYTSLNRAASDHFFPKISIVIPVRNRPDDLDRCLTSLEKIDYPAELLEIIVVDDGSDDVTPHVALQHQATLLCNPECRGASFSRNRGAEEADGDLICFLDSDCTADRMWLKRLVPLFRDSEVTAAGGSVSSQYDRTGLDRYEKACSSLHMGDHSSSSRNDGNFFYLPSCNLAVRKTAFVAAGGFNRDMNVGEDVDLCWRLMDRGGVLSYTPDAVVYHRHRNQLAAFARRRYQYGTSEPLLQSTHLHRKKILPVYLSATLFWTAVFLMLITISIPLISVLLVFLSFSIFGIDTLSYCRNLKKMDLGFSLPLIALARMRHYLSVLYHHASFFSRYYLIPAIILQILWPNPLSYGIIFGHIGVGLVRYRIKEPGLNPASFLLFFTVEQMAYQSGVWAACAKYGFYQPIFPKMTVIHIRIK